MGHTRHFTGSPYAPGLPVEEEEVLFEVFARERDLHQQGRFSRRVRRAGWFERFRFIAERAQRNKRHHHHFFLFLFWFLRTRPSTIKTMSWQRGSHSECGVACGFAERYQKLTSRAIYPLKLLPSPNGNDSRCDGFLETRTVFPFPLCFHLLIEVINLCVSQIPFELFALVRLK